MRTLRTRRLTLSVPTRGDVPAIAQICQDPEIQRWTTLPSPYRTVHAEGFIDMVESGWSTGGSPTWALRVKRSLVGMVGFMDEGEGSAEIGYWLARESRGQGLMDEAVGAVCDHGFNGMGLQRISWRANVGNLGSTGIARRAGFRYEGLQRLGLVQRGRRYDGWLAGRLATDGPFTRELLDAVAATWPPDSIR